VPTGACIPDPGRPSWRLRTLAVFGALSLLAGCAEIKSRLPQRGAAKPRPPATTVSKPRPAPKPAPVVAPAPAFVILDPAHLERDRARVRQSLASAEALPAADVGYTLDVLQGRLRQLAGGRASVMRRGQRLAVDLSRAVTFAPGKPQPAAGALLAPLGKLLGDYRQVLVTVRVDPAGDARLGLARAMALAQALADAGVAKRRIVVVGTTGARQPAGPRIELLLDPVVRAPPVRPSAR
jgi:outer membrane protein OmpA-like peptidoglycan-associated protein